MPMIETINLTKKYGELVALNNLNMTIDNGACYGFIGPNGAGKTTTIKILATLLKPTWGEARVDGKVVGYQNPQIRPVIGYVPDFMGAYEDMVVSEYLEFFAACYNIHGKQREQIVRDVLDLTDLNHKANAEVNGLSRGMKQRLSIARVLLHDPKVLLLDEPASGLDPRARIEIRELLKELRRMGKTIMISSHILHELSELCDTIGIIEQGELIFSGSVGEVMSRASIGQVMHIVVDERAEEAAKLLAAVNGIISVDVVQEDSVQRIELTIDPNSGLPISELPNRLIAQGFRLSSIHHEKVNLETAFMRLTKGLVSLGQRLPRSRARYDSPEGWYRAAPGREQLNGDSLSRVRSALRGGALCLWAHDSLCLRATSRRSAAAATRGPQWRAALHGRRDAGTPGALASNPGVRHGLRGSYFRLGHRPAGGPGEQGHSLTRPRASGPMAGIRDLSGRSPTSSGAVGRSHTRIPARPQRANIQPVQPVQCAAAARDGRGRPPPRAGRGIPRRAAVPALPRVRALLLERLACGQDATNHQAGA